MSEKIKFNYALESEGGALYKKYCDEKSIDYKVTAAANFCLGYMAEKSSPMWVKASDRLPGAYETLFIRIENTKSIASWNPHHEMFIDDGGDFHPVDQVEWLDESGCEAKKALEG